MSLPADLSETDPISLVVESVGSLVCVLDREGRIVGFNRACEELTGYTFEELHGRPYWERLLLPEEVETVRARTGADVASFPNRDVNVLLTEAGEQRFVSWQNHALLDGEGKIEFVVSTGVDITEERRVQDELREAERRYRSLVERLPAIVYTAEIGVHGRWLYTSPNIEPLLGFTPAEWAADPDLWFARIHPDDRERVRAYEEESFEEGGRYLVEYRVLVRDGGVVWLRDEGVVAGQAEPGRYYVHGFMFDISERKRLEEGLAEAERRQRALVEWLPAIVYTCDAAPEGGWVYVSSQIEAILGFTPEEWLSAEMPWARCLHPDDRERAMRTEEQAIAAGKPVYNEYRLVRPDGRIVWIVDEAVLVPSPEGGPTYLHGLMVDISERRESEQELRAANAKLQALIEASPLAIFSWGRDGRVLSWNPAAERILGWSESEVIGLRAPWVSPEMEEEFQGFVERGFRGETWSGLELRRRRKDGSLADLSVSTAALRDADGKIDQMVSVVADITDRKRAEALLRESEEQLRQSQKMEAVGKLAGGVAHDFNNLLTAIMGQAHLLLGDPAMSESARARAEGIAEAAERAAGLTRQLLAFSRRQVLSPRIIDLGDVVSGLEPMLRRLIGEDIEFVTVLPEGLDPVKADPGQLEQVVLNLVVNARDAMPSGGCVRMEVGRAVVEPGGEPAAGVYTTLTVADTGVGMDAETLERILEPFFTTKGAGGGTGLGLSTADGIVAQSDGSITVESEPGMGTTFTIYLPSAAGAVLDLIEGSEVPVTSHSAKPTETVLLVEDEEPVRELVDEALTELGYAVLEAGDGYKALELVSEHEGPIHLLLTDVVMPGMNGPELADVVREAHPETKVIFVSGYTEDAIAGYGAGGSGVTLLQKPFSLATLAETVRAVLDQDDSRPG